MDEALPYAQRQAGRDELRARRPLYRVHSSCRITPKLVLPLHKLTRSKAIMCGGDLTLEAPENPSRTHLESIPYDETVHLCRDWTALSSALRSTSLGFNVDEGRGLVPFDNSNWQPRRPVVPFEAV